MMTCEKCEKTYTSERPYMKHIETCTGPKEKKEPFSSPAPVNPSSIISARVAKQYEAMLSLTQLSLLGMSHAIKGRRPSLSMALTKDALSIEKEKKTISQGVGEFAVQHTWVEPAMKKVMEAFSIFALATIHVPLVEGVMQNHAIIDVPSTESAAAPPTMADLSA